MNDQKELKELSEVELKAAAYERVCLVQKFNFELQAIQQELQAREQKKQDPVVVEG